MNDNRRIDRREALRQIAVGSALIASVPMIPAQALVPSPGHVHDAGNQAAAKQPGKPLFFDAHQNETVTVLSELIIPATSIPGAKAAKVNEFINLMISDADDGTKRNFLRGLAWIDKKSHELFGTSFKDATVV